MAAFVSLACLATGARAQTTWYVDDDAPSGGDGTTWSTAYDSPSTALTAAQSGDQIWVAAGTYVGNFTLALGVEVYGGFAGTETELEERDWTANPTILDGNASGSVVTSPSEATATTRIDGFTITNGSGTLSGWYTYGGGLYLESSSPTIANNTITSNSARHGGGLHLESSSPTIANNAITGNTAGGGGGGLHLESSSPTIVSNTITGNSGEWYGGGLYLDSSSPTMANNTITGNSAGYEGGGLILRSSSPMIANNTITGNTGGGLLMGSSFPTIVNNTIAGNEGDGLAMSRSSPTIANNTITGNSGSGLYLGYFSSPTIANTIVAFNSSGVFRYGTSPSATLRCNCVYGNAEYDYDGLTDPTGTDGNISADPVFADPGYGNVHIQPDSPCVDAGNNADASGDFDMDGEPRIQPMGGTVDIGADESDGTVWPAGPYAVVRVSPVGDDANDGSSWPLAKRSVQAAIDAASALGGEVWVQAGTYYECVTLYPHAYLYGGFDGVETAREARDWASNVTTLDGQQQGSVVRGPGGYRGTGAIDGFTITNGHASDGGGLYLAGSSPTIANNTITGNSAWTGGGLYLWSSSPTIANNTITGNNADRDGGGLYLWYSSPTIANNAITDNGARTGGGMYLSSSSPTIANNTITGNDAGDGGGLYLRYSSPTIANTIVAFNSSGVSRYGTSPDPTLRYNCVYGNTEYDYSRLTDPTGTDGNIAADPLFADARYGHVHIQPDSPCVDAGNNADASGDFDMDGEPRIQPLGGTVDIGADESDGTVWPAGPYVVVRVSPAGDDANDGSSWPLAKRSVQAAIDAASVLGGEVWVQAGTYYGRITLHPYAYLYGGFTGVETERDQRDWAANVTTLDGQQQGSVVTARTGHRVSAIDGFTITNGSGTILDWYAYGGGLYLRSSSPTITNNTITGNNGWQLYGGGLYLSSSSPTIVSNTITRNNAYYHGGGLYLDFSSPTIANNTIMYNRAYSSGGGLYLGLSSPTIVSNTITDNSAHDGGGLYLYHFSRTIANNTISGNTAGDYGGGLYLDRSSPTIANNTITGNDARYGGGLHLDSSSPTIANSTITENRAHDGGGLHLALSSPTIGNNTIMGNSASVNGGGLYLSDSSPTIANTIVGFNSSGVYREDTYSSPALRYNCVYGNTEYDYGGLTDPTGTDGNISGDPLFVQSPDPGPDGLWGTSDDDLGDLQLSSGSPCIDAADNDSVPPDTPDLDGDGDTVEPLPLDLAGGPRFLDDPQTPDTGDPGVTGFPIVDVGAYEFASSCGNGVVDQGEDCDDGFADDCGTCNADCTGPGMGSNCGDGELCPQFEECDDAGESAECDADCTVAECGDGTLNVTAGEDCDPPGSDCCDASCYFEPSGTACGDPRDTECDNPDTCDGAGICLANHAPYGTPCDDGELCNGVEACDGNGTCVSEVIEDCNGNEVEDSCDIEDGTSQDCNDNTIPDECDIAAGTSADENGNGIPDECEMAEGVYLDIKPGGCPNPANPRSKGVVPVAIVGSESFDVAQIDTDTLALRRADGVGVAVTPLSGPPRPGIRTDDVATPFAGAPCDCHALGGDGIDDLLLKFSTPELTGAFELSELRSGASVVLTLSGSLLDGTTFEASDCLIIPGKPARARPRVSPRGK